ncbi:hypothetical protein [Bacillus sp. AK128]
MRSMFEIEEQGPEINISVHTSSPDLLKDEALLEDVVELAYSKKMTRFVGAIEPSELKPNWVFIFSLVDYFDDDDMLVRHSEASIVINRIKGKIK